MAWFSFFSFFKCSELGFFMLLKLSVDFFQLLECQTVCIKIRAGILSVLI